ncbi:DNA polymerase III subunit beta, partial [Aerococcus sp. L_32]
IMPLTMPEAAGDTVLDINIPGRSLQELIRIVDSNEDIEMMVTDNQVLFKARNIYLYSRLLEGNYPNTDRLLPNDHSTIIEVAASELVNAVERALILSHEGKNNVVRLNISDQDIILSSQSAEVGNVEEEINVVKAEGEALEISFNPDYLREALKSFGQQNVQIGFQSSSHPFTLLPSDQTDNFNFVQLITPIRTPRG